MSAKENNEDTTKDMLQGSNIDKMQCTGGGVHTKGFQRMRVSVLVHADCGRTMLGEMCLQGPRCTGMIETNGLHIVKVFPQNINH